MDTRVPEDEILPERRPDELEVIDILGQGMLVDRVSTPHKQRQPSLISSKIIKVEASETKMKANMIYHEHLKLQGAIAAPYTRSSKLVVKAEGREPLDPVAEEQKQVSN